MAVVRRLCGVLQRHFRLRKNSEQPVFSPCLHDKAARKSTNTQCVIFSNTDDLRHFGAFLDASQAIEILND
ncbi:hypothetical protein O0882_04510 [Janthinobacterium sp. SUN073]|uniref:hypothetical protein n=1 Tax=Janthinobacterium sp. SUN073 TaxID=3004102 RepID=UPI0025B06433|nr:hypothetical protein [Janthinobacterium sp. SUN073]MDN2695575.1 hypothetical protein [Janthinobacterium sp. SUN073]